MHGTGNKRSRHHRDHRRGSGASQRAEFAATLTGLKQRHWTNLIGSIRNILDGQRYANTLCTGLDLVDSMIIETTPVGLSDSSTLSDPLPANGEKE